MFSRSCWSFLCAVLAVATLGASKARSQCVGPDGLDGGPCCAPAGVTLPNFPLITQDVRWLCFDQCQPSLNTMYCVKVGAPIPIGSGGAPVCGEYRIRFVVSNCGTTSVVWNGLTKAHYSRTWLETPVVGAAPLQVWRFLINGDFGPTPALPISPCDRPGCLSTLSRVYFTGYIDYALDCATGQWQCAFALTHECDGIHHSPASVRPAPAGGYHPNRSFTMVSPGTPFTVSSTAPVQSDGPILQQAMRWNDWTTSPMICRFEEQCQGNLVAQNQFCFCSTAGANQYIQTFVTAQGACGSSVNPSPLGPFLQKRVGGWTAAATYPGPEFLLFDIGYLAHVNACNGVVSQQWFEGAETIGGYPAHDFTGVTLGKQFEDLESCNKSPNSIATIIGAPHVPYYVLNFNLP